MELPSSQTVEDDVVLSFAHPINLSVQFPDPKPQSVTPPNQRTKAGTASLLQAKGQASWERELPSH